MPKVPDIIIIEDHPVMREGLIVFFTKTNRWNVKGTASSLKEAKELLAVSTADLILIDIQLDDGWGLDIIPWLQAEKPNSKKPIMVVYTMFNDYAHVNAAMSLGVKAYITKRRTEQELENAMQRALAGETYIDETAQASLQNSCNIISFLTKREAEIFSLAKNGLSNKQIATDLGISYRTVENMMSSAYEKTGIKNRLELERL